MANLTIKIKVDDSAVSGLAKTLQSAIDGIEFKMDKTQLNKLSGDMQNAFKDIEIDIDTSGAMRKIEAFQSSVSELKSEMADMKIGFSLENLNAKDIIGQLNKQTKDGMEVKALQDYKKQLLETNDLRKQLKRGNNLDPHTKAQYKTQYNEMKIANERTEKLFNEQFNAKLNQRKEMADFHKDLDREYREYDPSIASEERSKTANDYMKEYQRNLKEVSKYQKEMDKSEPGTRSHEAASNMVNALRAEQNVLEASLKDLKVDIDTDDATSSLKNLLKLQEEVVRAATDDKKNTQSLKELGDIEKERAKLLQDSEKARAAGRTNESTELKAQADLKQLNIELAKSDDMYKNLSNTQKQAFDESQSRTNKEVADLKRVNEAKQQDADTQAKLKQQAADYKELEKATEDYYKTANKVAELQAKMDKETNTPKDGEKLIEAKALADAQKAQMDGLKNGLSDMKQYEEAYKSMTDAKDKSLDTNTKMQQDTQSQVADLRRVEDAYKQIEQSIREVDKLERAKDGAGQAEVQALDKQIAGQKALQDEIRTTNNLRENGVDSLEEEGRQLQENLSKARVNDRELKSARAMDNRQPRKTPSLTGGLFDTGRIIPTIDVMDVARETVQAAKYIYNGVADVDKSLVQVRKVVDATDQEWTSFSEGIYDNASEVGKSATEYAGSVGKWAQAGKDMQEAQRLAKISNIGAFVGELSEDQMIDYMSVPLNAFAKEGLEAHNILNAMNEVANNNAVEMDHLGAAYTRAAQTAALSGTSFSELTGLIGAAQESTRLGGETIGTSLRQMDVNIGRIATKSTKGLEKKFDFFKDIGVDITDTNGEIRSTFDILQDLEGVWGNLDSVTQRQAAIDLAGSRGQAVMSGLMGNWESVMKMMGEADGQMGFGEGFGSAYDEFAIQADSLEYKSIQVKNAWQEFLNTVSGGSDTFKGMFDVALEGIDKLTKFTQNENAMGFTASIASMLGAGFVTKMGTTYLDGFSKNLNTASDSMVGFNKNSGLLGKTSTIAGKGVGLLGKGVGLVSKTLGVVGLAAEVFFLADALGSLFGKDLSGWVSDNMIKPFTRMVNPAGAMISDFKESFAEYEVELGKFNKITDGLKSAQKMETDLEVKMNIKREAYTESGNIADLVLSADEFAELQEGFDVLLSTYNLEGEFDIRFNNYDHIMSQLDAVQSRIRELQNDQLAEVIAAETEAFNTVLDDSSTFNTYKRLEGERNRALKTFEASQARLDYLNDRNTSGAITDDEAKELWRLEVEIDVDRDSLTKAQHDLQKYLDDNDGRIVSADENKFLQDSLNKSKEARKTILDSYLSEGRGLEFLGGIDPKTTGLNVYFDMMNEVAKHQGQVDEVNNAFSRTKQIIQDLKDNGTDGLEDAGKEFAEVWNGIDTDIMSSDLATFFSENGLSQGDFSGFFDENGVLNTELLNQYVDLLGQAKDQHIAEMTEMSNATRALGEEFGLSGESIDKMVSSIQSGDMESYVRELVVASRDVGKLTEGLASLGIGFNAAANLDLLSGKSGTSIEDYLGDIQGQVDALDITKAVKLGVAVDESGLANYDKIIADITNMDNIFATMEDREILVSLGIIDAGTGLYDLEQLYALTDAVDLGEIEAELGVDFTYADEKDPLGALLQKIENKELTVQVTAEGELEITNAEGETYTAKGTVDWGDAETLDEYASEIGLDKEYTATVKVNTEIDTRSQDWLDGGFDTDGYVFTGVELQANAKVAFSTAEGDIDYGKVLEFTERTLANNPQHVEALVAADVKFDPENVTMDSLTDYVAILIKEGKGQEAQEFMMDIFPMFNLIPGSDLSNLILELIKNETPEEMETDDIVVKSGLAPQVAIAGGGAGPEEAEEIIQSRFSGISTEVEVPVKARALVESVETDSGALSSVGSSLQSLSSTTTSTITVDTEAAQASIDSVSAALDALAARTASVMVTANIFSALLQIAIVNAIKIPAKTVQIRGNAEHFNSVMNGLSGKSVTVAINGKSNKSTSITQGIGSLMSVGIGSAMNGTGINRSSAIGTNRSTASETKVNEDTWRYWAQQMYTGDPISNSMDKLSSELKSAGDDYAQIIKLTEQQIRLTKQQISHEEEMRRLEQTEMNEILASLRKEGFTTSGNRITNLDRAKTFEGDKASEVETLLNDWKSLYESIDSLDSTLAGLRADIVGFEEDIIDARKDIESDALEKQLKRSEALLKSIDNNTEIQSQRVSALDEYDFEFSVLVNENAILSSSQAIQQLIAEFNKLSLTSFEFDENAEDMYDHLEDVKGQILDNADAVLEYRNALNEIRITSLIDSFDKFTEAASRNTDTIQTNVDRLREGLLSGQGLSELGIFGGADFSQKSQFERDFEERLALEERLNEVLKNYSDTNIDRTRKASNAELQIQRDKYSQLIDMARDYSTGNLGESYGVGKQQQANEEFNDRQSELVESMDKYTERYQAMISRYNVALTQAGNTAQRQALYNNLIIEQLKLQEEYQYEIIAQNKEAIAQAQLLASNTSLTTSQKRELLDSVNEYQQNIVDAQQNIRDSIATRFEFEFELMDEATARYQDYYESLQYALEIAKITNVSASSLGKFYESIYGSLISQYDLAKRQLQELTAEQSKFENGSYEWELLAARIKETTQTVRDLGLEALNSNKDILDNTLDSLTNFFEKGFLDGATLEEWENYHKNWITGVEKELALEELRVKSLSMEDDVIKRRLEALDRQDEVSRKELEYLDKQMKLSELEAKLENISGERDVQTLTRRDDGTWGWDYVADQSEYESTQKEMLEAQKALEEFRREQRGSYVSSLGDIIGRAKDGAYDSPEDLQNDLNLLNAVYGSILSDIPGFQNMSLDDIVKAYQKYMADNAILAGDMMGDPTLTTPESQAIGLVSESFVASFMSVSSELGKIIGAELRAALGLTTDGTMLNNSGVVYNVANVELPNVTDGEGFANFFRDLPVVAEQQATVK